MGDYIDEDGYEGWDEDDIDQLEDFRNANGYEWPNCSVPDCENKECTWAGTGRYHPCSVRVLGAFEMERRYAITHPNGEWNGEVARPIDGSTE